MHGGEECGAYLRAAKHPALIVFDLDGTIADSRDMARESYKRVFAMMGYGMITDELADSFNGPDADEVCRVMGIGPDRRELYDKLVDQNDVELMSTMGRMFPGTIVPAVSSIAIGRDMAMTTSIGETIDDEKFVEAVEALFVEAA